MRRCFLCGQPAYRQHIRCLDCLFPTQGPLGSYCPLVMVAPDGYQPGESVIDYMAHQLAERCAERKVA